MSINITHQQRIAELIISGNKNEEIIDLIKLEYDIYLTNEQLIKIREPEYLQHEIKLIEENKNKLSDLIRKILISENYRPKTAKEIAQILYKKNNLRFSRREISQHLFSPSLKKEVNHCKITYTYTINQKSNITTSFTSIDNVVLDINSLVSNFQNGEILNELQTAIRQNFFHISSGNNKFDDLVKNILRDNIITPTEELFLIEKATELKVPHEKIEKIKTSIHQNNPYFDNIIHLVFENENVVYNELLFLREKIIEHNFSKKFFNLRFWQIGIKDYLSYLLTFKDFIQIIILWKLNQIIPTQNNRLQEKLFFTSLDVTKGDSFQIIINKGLNSILNEFYTTYKCKPGFINKITDSIVKTNFTHRIPIQNQNINEKNNLAMNQNYLIKIIEEEKLRIGSPAATLLAENIIFRLENSL
jgi:hypothetical protein